MLLDYLLSDEPDAPGEFSLVRCSRRAMATIFEVAIPVGSHPNPVAAAEDALDLIDSLEDQMTVFRDHSEVSRLNATAASDFVEVEPHLFELFSRCAVWTRETAGAFDIATGALTKAWGFYRRDGAVPPADELIAAMRATGFRHVVLDEIRTAIKFRVAGLELNLGAVGKGTRSIARRSFFAGSGACGRRCCTAAAVVCTRSVGRPETIAGGPCG